MTRFESHQRKINKPAEVIFNFISDFNNFQQAIPADKVEDWVSDSDSCSFSVKGIGKVALRIEERTPFKLIKIVNDTDTKHEFKLWFQIKQINPADTRIKITLDVKLSAMVKMVAKKPLQNFITTLIDQIADGFNR